MQPEPSNTPKPLYIPPREGVVVRDRSGRPVEPVQQAAAANIARSQIDSIYANDPHSQMPAQEPATAPATDTQSVSPPASTQPLHTESLPTITRSFTPEKEANPYARTHDESQLHADETAWQKYHSAWQSYYQQYFHRYYASHLQATHSQLVEHVARIQELEKHPPKTIEQTPEEALTDLRSQVRQKVRQAGQKARKSRHFVPIVSACIVMLVFAFLQYNAALFANLEAYAMPSSTEPASMIVRPSSTVAPDDSSRLIIPKIAVDVPIIWDATPKHESQMAAMKKGVAWFNIKGASARPGEVGNTVVSGHSSNDIFDDGIYKFVFARLDQLRKGDTVYINYEGTRYTYVVTDRRIVLPTQVSALTTPVNKPIITMITCTPLGTAEKRLLVTAEQISPNPNDAKAASHTASESTDEAMPGNAPTIFERMFGAR